jgi:hypothetical protein
VTLHRLAIASLLAWRWCGPSVNTLLLQALANLPEMSPKQPIVNKNQLAILSMWICGMPC